ncbi:glycosyl hydrolase, family 18, putative [Bacteroides helcogenes P 36-108]|uniref:Glycosyl hydrolase, family 18, putative n=2 Tax=Bacteroides helcogenes TaxID=290053 RepID=E6SU20_BACT6|nr:glycosyl hydrolase, family 18, putative [Bacteroides helcogenes P 36-108]
MPATAPKGSVWSVKLCTQLSTNLGRLLKEPRTVTMADFFVVGETTSTNPGGGTGGSGEDQEENPLG